MAQGNQTKASKEAVEASPVTGQTSYNVDAEVVENAPAGYDRFYVSPDEREALGVGDESEIAWVRNPKIWEKYEFSDRIREFQHERKGAKVVMDPDGDPITLGDVVLMKYPKVHKEREEAARTREYQDHFRDDPRAATMTREARQSRLKEIAGYQGEENRRSALVGPHSPTQGMDLETAYARLGRTKEEVLSKIKAEEARHRGSSRHQSFDSEDWGKMLDRTTQRQQRGGNRYAVGDTGFGRNPNSAVAQAARKAKGT